MHTSTRTQKLLWIQFKAAHLQSAEVEHSLAASTLHLPGLCRNAATQWAMVDPRASITHFPFQLDKHYITVEGSHAMSGLRALQPGGILWRRVQGVDHTAARATTPCGCLHDDSRTVVGRSCALQRSELDLLRGQTVLQSYGQTVS